MFTNARVRVAVTVSCLAFALGCGHVSVALADPAPTPTPVPTAEGGLLSESEALRQAKATGSPVVVSALTDERTLVTADPSSGQFIAELTANVARVKGPQGGWRAPSTKLVRGSDGLLRPEAAVAQIAISPGGPSSAPLAVLSDGSASLQFGWPTRLPAAVVDGATATYPEVYPGVDLVVQAGLESVETFLVVKSRAAALNPAVRAWSMPMTVPPGMSAKALPNGGKVVIDAKGLERFQVPQALMWDSSGKPDGSSSTVDLIADVAESRVAPVDASMAAGRLSLGVKGSFLDDPATVFPVVIDPAASLSQTHVLRVTDDWSKWDDAVGDHGKIGYNGWTSPYYRSRMFYQFAWPVSGLKSSQIRSGVFEYVQDHSTQHSPCVTTSTAFPGVRAKLANAIDSSDTWSDRTGDAWHPQASVFSRMAVGHEDYCNDTYREKWNLTGALQIERTSYDYRTTVTVGLYSDDEADRDGWKHYLNEGTSPKLVLTYEKEPLVPAVADLAVSAAPVPQTSPRRTLASTPTLSSKVSLESGYNCQSSTACLQAEFEVTGGPSTISINGARVTQSNQISTTAALPAMTAGTYNVRVRARNVDTNLVSGWSASIPLVVDLAPAAPSWSWLPPVVQASDNLPAASTLQISATAASADADVTQLCAAIVQDSSTSEVCANATGTPKAATITAGPFVAGKSYAVTVAAKDPYQSGVAKADTPSVRAVPVQ